jgi:hypothetical protein
MAFIGAAALSQVWLFSPGAMGASERLHGLMETGGVDDCGGAANSAGRVPEGNLAHFLHCRPSRETTKQGLRDRFFRDERKGGADPAG